MKQPEEIATCIKEKLAEDGVEFAQAEVGQPWVLIQPGSVLKIAKFLRDDPELRFNTLMCLSGVHYPDTQELGVTYHLHSTTIGHTVVLKVRVPVDNPRVPSVETIWKTADWHEREAYDMVGVVFDGHPNMSRILCPDDWEGYPLRKDYVQQETYLGVTTRS
jgi:NADH-quinone oxidoreductase subunit C